eukprot:m.112270 g.112270  ORF g.112270 m.112270 type:complete len:126 (+) comp15320_c0_seq2:73-450(+)
MASTRSAALRLYRQMLKTAKTWEAVSAAHTQEEQQYIVDEARRLFRQNKTLTGEDVDAALKEAETRLETAVHYRNPYPRLVSVQLLELLELLQLLELLELLGWGKGRSVLSQPLFRQCALHIACG